MKILFLIPPSFSDKPPAERIFGCNYGIYNQPNIFILYSAAVLKNAGYSVEIKDFSVSREGLKAFSDFCGQQTYDLIIFYTVFLSSSTDLEAREMIFQKHPSTRFVFLATEPTASPEKFVSANSFVIRGEPELTLLELVNSIQNSSSFEKITGLSFLDNGQIKHNPGRDLINNLDILPFPDRSFLERNAYANPKLPARPFTTVLTSRGCSYRCRFCVPNSISFAGEIEFKRNFNKKPSFRRRSNENILAELQHLKNEGYRSITFIDDQFIWNEKETAELCRGMKKMGFQWTCLARADRLQNEEMLKEMAEAGCRSIDIGVESLDDEILTDIKKDCTSAQIELAIQKVAKAGIEPKINILIGASEKETEATIEATFSRIKKFNVDIVMFSICTPFPHTEFNRLAAQNGWMIAEDYFGIDPMKQSFISYPHLSKSKLERIIRSLYRRYYFRPSYIFRQLRKIESSQQLLQKVMAAIKIFN
ncbi:MAG: B12-binding domain-containing radical SAM protein [Candidatus Rifleibacteriota bacterium]